MTDKRFRLGADFDGFNNIYDNERTIGCERTIYATKMVKLLNELAEENQQLINDCSILVQSNQDYRKENEQLKQFIQELTTKGIGKIYLANGNIYKVNAILTDFKR